MGDLRSTWQFDSITIFSIDFTRILDVCYIFSFNKFVWQIIPIPSFGRFCYFKIISTLMQCIKINTQTHKRVELFSRWECPDRSVHQDNSFASDWTAFTKCQAYTVDFTYLMDFVFSVWRCVSVYVVIMCCDQQQQCLCVCVCFGWLRYDGIERTLRYSYNACRCIMHRLTIFCIARWNFLRQKFRSEFCWFSLGQLDSMWIAVQVNDESNGIFLRSIWWVCF